MNYKPIKNITLYLFCILLFSCSKNGADTTIPQNGKSGSLARMINIGNYLYVIDNKTLTTFDISNANDPIEKSKKEVGFGIETLFPFANYLFIGSTDGLYIYDISNPENPVSASSEKIEHFTSCDPVVANSNFAYVTLNTLRETCGSTMPVNELQIVNVQSIFQPYVENIIQMKGPKGLGLDGNTLFVCDADLGVVLFDLSIAENPIPFDTLDGFTANDLIPNNGNLMVVSEDGLRQFDYTDLNNISLISFLDLND